MLEVVHDPTANPAFVRLATGPRWRIDARDLAALGDRAATLSGSRRRTEEPGLAAALDDAVAGREPPREDRRDGRGGPARRRRLGHARGPEARPGRRLRGATRRVNGTETR